MAKISSSPHTLRPRQAEEVWSAFHNLQLPAKQKDTVHRALWKRLPAGHRHAKWKPLEVWCPLDGELETIDHALHSCQFYLGAFNVIDTAFRLQEKPAF